LLRCPKHADRFLQHGIKHRLKAAERIAYYLEHLRRGCLFLARLI
jgi:hypothetical protein